MTRVSVVIPTYNRAPTLPRALESTLAQTIDDLEILVVDDGSTDDTASVLATYQDVDSRVRPVVHATNQGANVARNTGIEHARGEYIAFLDSDDEWHPEKLERQLAALEDRPDEWVGVYCDAGFELSAAKTPHPIGWSIPSFEAVDSTCVTPSVSVNVSMTTSST